MNTEQTRPSPAAASGKPDGSYALIEKLCEQLRSALDRGESAAIEKILPQAPRHLRERLLVELIAEEAQIRASNDDTPQWTEYAERFRDDLKAAWNGFRHFNPELPPPEGVTISTAGPEAIPTTNALMGGAPATDPVPDQLGKYRILATLGSGSFGRVFKAVANDDNAEIAIKQLKSKWASVTKVREQFVAEARRMMQFDHPGVVRVFELDEQSDPPFIVQELIDGGDLAKRLRAGKLSPPEATELAIQIADALAYIHSFKLYHRDLKPANVLIDPEGHARITDFGLALADADRWDQPNVPAGTFLYMAPEQLHGRWHLLNPRCDLWSLGIIYYEMLTGERPFQRTDFDELRREISSRVPPSPRDLDQSIPQAINRLCMSCLEKPVRLRPASAADLRDDLRRELDRLKQPAETASPAISSRSKNNIYPKPTLRRFTAEQAELYLSLMPRSYSNPDELPELIHYWKQRIENTDPDETFRIGVLVGVSGCGKSSLLEAGLLPRLAGHVRSVLIQASEADTEVQLLKALKKAFPKTANESTSWTLPEWTRRLRSGELLPGGHKFVLVLDQFEQWLHARGDEPVTQLRDALQQCDGQHLQTIICVREGFHSSLTRFVESFDIVLDGEVNYATAHRFDIGHARYVLEQFGRGTGRLKGELTGQQKKFLDKAIEDLAHTDQDGVRSVRLVVLALVMAQRDWTVDELEQLGGLEGIGRQFLLDSFEGRTADEQYRRLLPAAMRVLDRLVPESGLEIKDSRTYAELLQASELSERDFDRLLEILVRKLFLVTPVDPDSGPIDERSSPTGDNQHRYYQLTHDFLVPSVRQWIEFKEEQSPSGRARLQLRRLTSAWLADHQNRRHLPSLPEYLQIRRRTQRQRWTEPQEALMSRATRFHASRFLLGTTALVLLIAIGMVVRSNVARQQEAIRIQGLVDSLINAEPDQLPDIIARLDENAELAQQYLNPLKDADAQTPDEKRAQLHARLACVSRDPSLVEPLKEQLLTNKPAYIGPIRQLLRPYASDLIDELWEILRNEVDENKQRRFRAAIALAGYVSADKEDAWTKQDLAFVARELTIANAELQPLLRHNLRPISRRLLHDLEVIFGDQDASDAQRLSAANAFSDYADSDIGRLSQLLTVATPEQFDVLYPLVAASPSPASVEELGNVAATLPPDELGSVERIAFGQRRANAAITLLRLGEREKALRVFDYTDDPEALTQFVFRCRERGVEVESLLDLLEIETRRMSERPAVDIASETFRRSARARYALLLALGEFTLEEIPEIRRDAMLEQLADWYANDPSSGVHGAAGWLLRRWGQGETARKIDQTEVSYSPDRQWFTLAITVTPTQAPKPEETSPRKGQGRQADTDEADDESAAAGTSDETETASVTDEPSATESAPPPRPTKTFYYTFIVYPAGVYWISSLPDEPERQKDELRHQVELTRPFAVLDREVTMEELIAFEPLYVGFMQNFDASPTDAGFGADWYDSVGFCRWLGEQTGLLEDEQAYASPDSLDEEEYPREPDPMANWAPRDWPVNLDRRGFRLPTDSEWEVAARAGARTAYGFGSEASLLGRFGWFVENSGKEVHAPRELRPSIRGLFDIHGNLFEWTHDWKKNFETEMMTDPVGPRRGSVRVYRGGSWGYGAAGCRAADRYADTPTSRTVGLGFRLALSPSGRQVGAQPRRERSEAATGDGGVDRESGED